MEDVNTELTKLSDEVETILNGIDRTETDDPGGWWETSTGAEFGKERLRLIRDAFARRVKNYLLVSEHFANAEWQEKKDKS